MTGTRPEADWSDERLRAAFVARGAAVHDPGDLVSGVRERLATEPAGTGRRPALGLAWVAAAVAAIVAITIGTAALGQHPSPTPAGSPPAASAIAGSGTASPGSEGSHPSTSDLPAPASTTWVGEPITVAEAIDHRDNHLDDTELAVEGFSWRPGLVASCALQLRPMPAAARCGDNITWISDADPGPETGQGFQPPAQPALQLLIRPDTYAQVPLPPQPGRVIVLGHFDDHRSADCPPQADCRHNFLVDAILDPNAPSLDRRAIDGRQIESGVTARITPENAVEIATGLPPGADRVVVASPVSGTTIGGFEPKAAEIDALSSSNAVWLIRYLGRTDNRPVLKTVLVADRSDLLAGNVFPVLPNGDVTLGHGIIEPAPNP